MINLKNFTKYDWIITCFLVYYFFGLVFVFLFPDDQANDALREHTQNLPGSLGIWLAHIFLRFFLIPFMWPALVGSLFN